MKKAAAIQCAAAFHRTTGHKAQKRNSAFTEATPLLIS